MMKMGARSRVGAVLLGISAAMVPATAALAGAEGVWTDGNSCSAGSEGRIEVSRQDIEFYETSCRFGGRAPAGFGGVSGVMQCSGEGESFVRELNITASGDRLYVGSDNERPVSYRRCSGATTPVRSGGNGAAEVIGAAILFGTIVKKLAD